jgi:hypothetical protein
MILEPNEVILKEIFPKKSFFLNTTEKIRIIFSFFFLSISIFFIVKMVSFLSIFAIIMFLIGLYLAFFRWVFKYLDLKNDYYLITNQRIIIAEKATREILKSKELSEVGEINVEMNASYFGNIIFGQPEGIFGRKDESYFFGGNGGMSFKEDEYAFLSVENINEILSVFESLG